MKPNLLRFALVGAALFAPVALASPRSHRAKATKQSAAKRTVLRAQMAPRPLDQSKLPRYVSLSTIERLQREYRGVPLPALQPFWQGHAIKRPMSNLLDGPVFDEPAKPVTRANAKVAPKKSAKVAKAAKNGKRELPRFAQGFPRPIPPAAVPSYPRTPRGGAARTVVPNWVRYPLEFQLAGIGLGSKAVDKDRFNRIDRYGLFALHGNPTAVVVPIITAAAGGAAGAPGAAPGGAPGAGAPGGAAPGGAPGGGAPGGAPGGGAAAGPQIANLTLNQQPPGVAALFPQSSQFGGLPDWALAVTVDLKAGEVEWLYKRETYAMGFVVDRLGFCEAIIVAGIQSPIARTQQEDPIHTVKLGDDFRKVQFRYGYPDDVVPLGPEPVASANSVTGTPGGGAGGAGAGGAGAGGAGAAAGAAAGGAPGGGAAGGAGATTQVINGAFRTYDLRYDQTYNTVFTIRNNRVVRIYIFGDPDFFTDQRRNSLRTRY